MFDAARTRFMPSSTVVYERPAGSTLCTAQPSAESSRGVGVTMTSVGAGALGLAVLVALYPLPLPSDRLVATDIAHALPITAIAAAQAGIILFGTTWLTRWSMTAA